MMTVYDISLSYFSNVWKTSKGKKEGKDMIVEVFFRGSNFKKIYDTFWNIKTIERNGNNFILVTDKNMTDNKNVVLDINEYELRVAG